MSKDSPTSLVPTSSPEEGRRRSTSCTSDRRLGASKCVSRYSTTRDLSMPSSRNCRVTSRKPMAGTSEDPLSIVRRRLTSASLRSPSPFVRAYDVRTRWAGGAHSSSTRCVPDVETAAVTSESVSTAEKMRRRLCTLSHRFASRTNFSATRCTSARPSSWLSECVPQIRCSFRMRNASSYKEQVPRRSL